MARFVGLSTQTFNGIPSGMNLALAPFELADTEAQYLQDILLDKPGLTRRRGPVQAAANFPTFTEGASGMVGTINPAGSFRMALLTGNNSNGYLRMLDSTFTSYQTYNWSGALPTAPTANPYRIVDTKPALLGGAMIGTSSQYNAAGPVQNISKWFGGNMPDTTTGTISTTRGSSVVTGAGTSWVTTAAPGMFVFVTVADATNTGNFNTTLVGTIKSVDSNTQVTMVSVSPYTTTATAFKFTSVRGIYPKVVKGRITTTTASKTVTGSSTKFVAQFMDETVSTLSGTTTGASALITGISSTATLAPGMRVQGTNIATGSIINSVDSASQVTLNQNTSGAGTQSSTYKHGWNLYRASDGTWIGRVDIVNNDTAITLAANAAVAMNNELYIAIDGNGDWTLSTSKNHGVGFLNATYANRQWYSNNGSSASTTSRVWFSDTADADAIDMASYDGDFIDIASAIGSDTPIKAIMPAYNALVVIKENETFAINGSTPTTFAVKKIEDDGTLAGMSAQGYGGGVIWAGRLGIYFYDGITVNNLTAAKLGNYYKNAIRNVDPTQYRMWSMIARDHYFLFIENMAPSVSIIKGQTSYTPTSMTIVVNMVSEAVTFHTNLNIRGWVQTPSDTGKQTLYVVNANGIATICSANDLFDAEGVDTLLCDLGSSGGVFNFGTTAVGSSTIALAADTKYFAPMTTTVRSAVRSIRAYIGGQNNNSTAQNIRAGIYSDVAGAPTTLLGTSNAVSVVGNAQPTWVEFTFPTNVEISAGNYWIGVQESTTGSHFLYYTTSATVNYDSNADTYGDGLATPFGAPTTTLGVPSIYAVTNTVGPDFYIESKKYSEQDTMRKKLFKQLALTYELGGDTLQLDTVVGMNTIGKTSTSVYPTSIYTWTTLSQAVNSWYNLSLLYPTWNSLINAVFVPKRVKFLKRTQMMSFRLWQTSPQVTRCVLGPFQIGFKWQRTGRI
jgi:hypothetical protein